MKAAIYNPYMDTLGGGEKYTLSFAKVLLHGGYQVYLQWKNSDILDAASNRFGVDYSNINITRDVQKGSGYDLCFWVSDGSIPLLKSRKNILHFQVPFTDIKGKTLLNRMKIIRINYIICNSNFTKSYIDKEYGVRSIVIYPPVETVLFKPQRKEDIILYVGRFSDLKQSKSHSILIDVFKKLYSKKLGSYKLILAGGIEIGSKNYLTGLKKEAMGYPVEFIESPDFKSLKSLYGKARFFWSASGFGVDEKREPDKVEHFGITTVEAMASGCIPIVFNGGGYKEIINEGINGFLWESKNDLMKKTMMCLSERITYRNLSSIRDSTLYGVNSFNSKVANLLKI